jgi:hypothetical protein
VSSPAITLTEEYLRHIEHELMIKGGRWIATFNTAVRNFNLEYALGEKGKVSLKNPIDCLIYGGVKQKGFLLSKAFSFLASPTYKVGCAAIHIKNATKTKWSFLVDWMREVNLLKESMEFEWIWVLFYGEGEILSKVINNIERHSSREYGVLYADLKNKCIFHSDSFISRRGAKLFNPEKIKKGKSRWK